MKFREWVYVVSTKTWLPTVEIRHVLCNYSDAMPSINFVETYIYVYSTRGRKRAYIWHVPKYTVRDKMQMELEPGGGARNAEFPLPRGLGNDILLLALPCI